MPGSPRQVAFRSTRPRPRPRPRAANGNVNRQPAHSSGTDRSRIPVHDSRMDAQTNPTPAARVQKRSGDEPRRENPHQSGHSPVPDGVRKPSSSRPLGVSTRQEAARYHGGFHRSNLGRRRGLQGFGSVRGRSIGPGPCPVLGPRLVVRVTSERALLVSCRVFFHPRCRLSARFDLDLFCLSW